MEHTKQGSDLSPLSPSTLLTNAFTQKKVNRKILGWVLALKKKTDLHHFSPV